ncbi:Tricarboxylate/iron carrier [Ascobolus immersus RN42]|uniref:Tricarboxylate/iron carrier n=1 Tax=Ascobolus immersus RN42 TaxID=1160509 RepID=A0A3N4HTL8_ASCIM|nr:Tricarboxylate/iron carrier [Ascobolus immersus RN42]
MSASIPGPRDLPPSQYDLTTYPGRVAHAANLCDPRTLFTSDSKLKYYATLISQYKNTPTAPLTPEVWTAKKTLDATLHPDTGEKVLLPCRMSSFIFTNLIITAGMLQPNLGTRGVLFWQVANQTLNVAVNAANANKSSPPSWAELGGSYVLAVGASCGVAFGLGKVVPRLKVRPNVKMVLGRLVPFAAVISAGLVNVGVMRFGEIRDGINVFGVRRKGDSESVDKEPSAVSRVAAAWAVGETAASRVINAAPIMVIPPLVLVRLQSGWLKQRPRLVLPVNLGLIFATSVVALPLALGVFPQRERMAVSSLEGAAREQALSKGLNDNDLVEFNRGI